MIIIIITIFIYRALFKIHVTEGLLQSEAMDTAYRWTVGATD